MCVHIRLCMCLHITTHVTTVQPPHFVSCLIMLTEMGFSGILHTYIYIYVQSCRKADALFCKCMHIQSYRKAASNIYKLYIYTHTHTHSLTHTHTHTHTCVCLYIHIYKSSRKAIALFCKCLPHRPRNLPSHLRRQKKVKKEKRHKKITNLPTKQTRHVGMSKINFKKNN